MSGRVSRLCIAAFKRKKLSLAISALLCPPLVAAAPYGGQVTSGAAAISQAGGVTDIHQSTQKAAINWQGFSVAPSETVNFRQPNASAMTLNRVVGNEQSVIQGAINANGKVFLINSNGVLFSQGSRVNTGGLVASTLDISDRDFENGNYVFKGRDGGGGSVVNMGTLTAADGGYVALLGESVSNQGVIMATQGTVSLNGAKRVTLNFNGDSLLSVSLDEGALDALVENKGAVYADGGKVILTARAADDVLGSQVNNSGIAQARTLGELKGDILAYAYGGTANVAGTLDASAPDGGDGGFIETSGDRVRIAETAQIRTRSAQGRNGTWLIDPVDFTIAASGGDMTGAFLSNYLNTQGDYEVQSSIGSSGTKGDINVNDAVNWASDNTLTLTAAHDININAPITASGAGAGLMLNYGGEYNVRTKASYSGTVLNAEGIPVAKQDTSGGVYGSVTFTNAATQTNIENKTGLVINGVAYTLIHSMNDLASISGADKYALAQDIDAAAWSAANMGRASVVSTLTGTLAGLGHSLDNLTLNGSLYVGLIGTVNGATIRDIGVEHADISANSYAGVLAARINGTAANISNSYATGKLALRGAQGGGLVGLVNSTVGNPTRITSSYADVDITGATANAGGLVGIVNRSSIVIDKSHATGSVTGKVADGDETTQDLGGLIGSITIVASNPPSSIANSYATGAVTGSQYLGGLIGRIPVGSADGNMKVANSFATGDVTATAAAIDYGAQYVGGLIGYAARTDIDNSYAEGDVSISGRIAHNVGGLAGWLEGAITNSHATGNVSATGDSSDMIGGLVGTLGTGSSIANSYATGNVKGNASSQALGGLVGFAGASSSISKSWASGNVIGGRNLGGLVGVGHGDIFGSSASGDVTALSSYYGTGAGGLVGVLFDGSVTDSTATGSVTGVDNLAALVGETTGITSITNSTASGRVTGTGNNVGGLVGYAGGVSTSISRSYWNMDSTGQRRAIGGQADGLQLAMIDTQGLTGQQFEDVRYYLDGTIDQVLADRAAQAAADEEEARRREAEQREAEQREEAQREAAQRELAQREAAQRQARFDGATQVAGGAVAGARQQALYTPNMELAGSLMASLPTSLDPNIVFTPGRYSAGIQSIEVDGQTYQLDKDESKDNDESKDKGSKL
ncbi:two-partner secretion domain-containing protein [Pollutimonas bauzanensis]|uniref:Filamentous hemagglutinin family N-terminal domain-containing protein n=1 Tax=Pollutimonas bauzanensis TaxID=658167 RepID=A0A1M5RFV4_9BURK|nr:GLUG motif-containing protein [Pollutimonas bauzanensis]SHH24889.1 filamentous hemagglutinin family N-terminal domain-containing protein [Pollutimonas bauzanensis]